MVFGKVKKRKKRGGLSSPRPKKKNTSPSRGPLYNIPVEHSNIPQDNDKEAPPPPLLEGVQTISTNTNKGQTNDTVIVNEENDILFPNYKKDNQVERLVIAYAY